MNSESGQKKIFICVAVSLVALAAVGGIFLSSKGSNGATSLVSNTQNQQVSNSQPTSSSPDYSTAIPTDETVKAFADGLKLGVNQSDPSRGIGFPDVSRAVDFWSASYGKLLLLIYPDKSALDADSEAFKANFDTYSQLFSNSQYTWTSCTNVMAVYPSIEYEQVQKIMATWCTFSTPTPTESATSQQDSSAMGGNSNYQLGYNTIVNSTVGQLQANNFYAFLSPSGGITKNSATDWCTQVTMRVVRLRNQVGDAQGISDWINGCVNAAIKIAQSVH